MPDRTFLSTVESALSAAWGGAVELAIQESFPEHTHVARVRVAEAPASSPSTVVVKRGRGEGQMPWSAHENSVRHLATEWASIRFLAAVFGETSPAPKLHVGDLLAGFLVLEDLGDRRPLRMTLWGEDPVLGTQTMARYGSLLGQLHAKTAAQSALFAALQREVNPAYEEPYEDFVDMLQPSVETLNQLGMKLSSAALEDIREAGQALNNPGNFTAFLQGDPVETNIIEWQGRWRLIDFETGAFRHALLEGVFPRMLIPTTGLRDALRIPETAWRQAEAAYRAELSSSMPEASSEALYGAGLTAASAFWTLVFCHKWLEQAVDGGGPAERATRIRQCTIACIEQFVGASKEFNSLTRLGHMFESLGTQLRAQWTEEACTLPYYPAFHSAT